MCPSTCNVCEIKEPKIETEDIEAILEGADVVGSIVKASENNQIPDKVTTCIIPIKSDMRPYTNAILNYLVIMTIILYSVINDNIF